MNIENKKILVTGGNGLIGKNLLLRLKNSNNEIYSTEHITTDRIPGISYIQTDLNVDDCNKITKNMDVVIHCAANSSGAAVQESNPLTFVRDNVIMNLNMLEACYTNSVNKFIWMASTTGYPSSDNPMKEDDMFVGDPFDKYFAVGWMKRYTEKLCELFSTKLKNKMSCIVLRPTNIYGPHDKIDPKRSHVLTALIRKIVEKQNPIEVWGDGNDIRDVLYVDDMVDAILLSIEKLYGFEQINIGYGKSFTVIELLTIIKNIAKCEYPHKLIINGPRMIPIRKVNIDKANAVLGWTPKTDIEDGIRQTYVWMKKELNIS